MIAHKNTLPSTLLEKCLISNPKTQQVQLEPTNFYIFSFRLVTVVPNKMASHVHEQMKHLNLQRSLKCGSKMDKLLRNHLLTHLNIYIRSGD